jgi:hypothetical protein
MKEFFWVFSCYVHLALSHNEFWLLSLISKKPKVLLLRSHDFTNNSNTWTCWNSVEEVDGNLQCKKIVVLWFMALCWCCFVGVAYEGKDIVFKFVIEYSRFKRFWPLGNNRSIFIWGFSKDDILACVETWD